MQDHHLKSALELFQRPAAVADQLGVARERTLADEPAPEQMNREEAAELLLALADGSAAADEQLAVLYERVKEKNAETTRSVEQVLDYASQAYELLRDNWGALIGIIAYLDRLGKFDQLKKKKRWKAFFDTVLQEKKDK